MGVKFDGPLIGKYLKSERRVARFVCANNANLSVKWLAQRGRNASSGSNFERGGARSGVRPFGKGMGALSVVQE